jgi:uncharacterized protein (DUF302 family)
MPSDSSKGIIDLPSPWSVGETVDRIVAILSSKKIKLFARIDQAAEAASIGLTLRPTVLLIFGDPAKGTPLMDSYPSLAMDLPIKALVWEAKPGEVYVSLNTPDFLQQRHQLPMAPFAEVAQLFTMLLKKPVG